MSFFKGLQVYPQPQVRHFLDDISDDTDPRALQELLVIYSKTQPAEVVQLLMDALKLSISEGDSLSPSDSSPSRREAAGGSQSSGAAVLEEIDTDSQEGT